MQENKVGVFFLNRVYYYMNNCHANAVPQSVAKVVVFLLNPKILSCLLVYWLQNGTVKRPHSALDVILIIF